MQKNTSNIAENNIDEFTKFFELSTLLSNNSADDVALVYGAKDLKPYLENFRALTDTQAKTQIFKNPEKESFYSELSEPITLKSSFRLLINFNNQTNNSGLIISGKENLQENNWWQGIHQLRIGYNKEKKGYYVSVLNGQKEKSAWYQILKNTKPGQTLILEFANSQGQGLLIKNIGGQILTELKAEEMTSLKMRDGLFPYSSLKIGINLPPSNEKLIINKFFLYNFDGQG